MNANNTNANDLIVNVFHSIICLSVVKQSNFFKYFVAVIGQLEAFQINGTFKSWEKAKHSGTFRIGHQCVKRHIILKRGMKSGAESLTLHFFAKAIWRQKMHV